MGYRKKKMLHCENCHAPISADDAKCPYCGALNALGGEKQYMEKLYDLKGDVEELKDVPLKEYKREFGQSSRIIKRTLIICSVIAVLIFGLFLGIDKLRYPEMPVAERKEQLLWEKENFPKLDAMYEDGDYDGILEFENANCRDGYYSIYDWKHHDFISLYRWYVFCKESAMQTEVKEMLSSRFNLQEKDFDALYAECCKEDEYGTYFNYKLAEKKIGTYIKDNMENGKVVR